MGGYSKSGPFVNNSSPGISATFLNAVESVLSRGTGDTETGKYWIGSNTYTSGGIFSQYMSSLSRSSTPASVTVDETDQAHSNCVAITAAHLSANGFQVWTSGVGANISCNVAGNTTIHY